MTPAGNSDGVAAPGPTRRRVLRGSGAVATWAALGSATASAETGSATAGTAADDSTRSAWIPTLPVDLLYHRHGVYRNMGSQFVLDPGFVHATWGQDDDAPRLTDLWLSFWRLTRDRGVTDELFADVTGLLRDRGIDRVRAMILANNEPGHDVYRAAGVEDPGACDSWLTAFGWGTAACDERSADAVAWADPEGQSRYEDRSDWRSESDGEDWLAEIFGW